MIGIRGDRIRSMSNCHLDFHSWILDSKCRKLHKDVHDRRQGAQGQSDDFKDSSVDAADRTVVRAQKSLLKMKSKLLSIRSFVELPVFSTAPVVGAEYRANMHGPAASDKDCTVVRIVSRDMLQRTVLVEEYAKLSDGFYVLAAKADVAAGNKQESGDADAIDRSTRMSQKLRWLQLGPRVWLHPTGNEGDRFEIFGSDPLIVSAGREYKYSSSKGLLKRLFSRK